jgi:hypothetical protein
MKNQTGGKEKYHEARLEVLSDWGRELRARRDKF